MAISMEGEKRGLLRRRGTGSSGGSNSEPQLKPSDIQSLLSDGGGSDQESLIDDASGCDSDGFGSDISLEGVMMQEHTPERPPQQRRRYRRGYPLLLLGASAVLIAVWMEGFLYPGDSTMDMTSAPLLAISSPALTTIAKVRFPLSSMAVSPNGTIYMAFQEYRGSKVANTMKTAVLLPESSNPEPFPSSGFQRVLNHPSAVLVDSRRGWVWILDHGKMGLKHPCLYAFDVETRKQLHHFTFHKRFAGYLSHYQRMVLDPNGEHIYIADSSALGVRHAAIVVYNIAKQVARHTLAGHHSTKAKRMHLHSQGTAVTFAWGLIAFRAGVTALSIDSRKEYLYYSALPDDLLYRIPLATLRDDKMSNAAAENEVEVVARMPTASSIVITDEETLYLTEPERESIMRMQLSQLRDHSDGSGTPRTPLALGLETVIRDSLLRWPDCLGISADGLYVYFADTAVGDVIRGTAHDIAEYNIYRLSLKH